MRIALILTNDWELPGDGSGDFWELQHRPLRQLLQVCQEFAAPLTVMAEVAQQWAHQVHASRFPALREEAQAWEADARQVLQAGGDVQLHLHPQWLDARFDEHRQRWILNCQQWSTGQLSEHRLRSVLKRGKDYLETLLRPVRHDYTCLAFRAGAYCLPPSHPVLSVLEEAGFRCDSSVAPGYRQAPYYDYRAAAQRVAPWYVSRWDVQREARYSGQILEIPVATVKDWQSPVLRRSLGLHGGSRVPAREERWWRAARQWRQAHYPLHQHPHATGSHATRWRWPRKLLHRSPLLLDYDLLPATHFVNLLERLALSPAARACVDRHGFLPLVVTGHTKNMPNADNLVWILEKLRRRWGNTIEFWTLTQAIQTWESAHAEVAGTDRFVSDVVPPKPSMNFAEATA